MTAISDATQHDLPPLLPGWKRTSGKSGPRDGKWFVQLRSGWIDHLGPWPAKGPRWEHDGGAFDVVAVKREG